MMKVNAFKDGKGNIVITEDSFEMLLGCLDNQKFVGELPQNGDSISVGKNEYYKTQQDIQDVIDQYNRECRGILHGPTNNKENFNDIVSELNRELFDKVGEIGIEYGFNYETTGYEDLIKFGGNILWCSEWDERKFDEEKNEYEPLEPFIKQEFNTWVDKLNTLKF